MHLHVIVDHMKKFIDIFVGIPKFMNGVRVFHLSSIYCKVTWGNLFNEYNSHEGFKPYVIKDKGYPLFLWLMVPHKQIIVKCYVLKALYNR